jgi:putative oxidoreductase
MISKHVKTSKPWHVSLWVSQILLAAMFLAAGFMKTVLPLAELSQLVPLAAEMPGLIRFVGVSELAGGLGLLLPAGLRIWPQLTVVAAAALAGVMVLAMIFHLARGEASSIGMNILLGGLAAFIAWGRLNKAPIAARPVRTNSIERT